MNSFTERMSLEKNKIIFQLIDDKTKFLYLPTKFKKKKYDKNILFFVWDANNVVTNTNPEGIGGGNGNVPSNSVSKKNQLRQPFYCVFFFF